MIDFILVNEFDINMTCLIFMALGMVIHNRNETLFTGITAISIFTITSNALINGAVKGF